MPIQSSDIKLIKSSVLADTSDGGGAMTGVPLISGMSNNLFPDISDTDRALGRVQMRKVFGVAQSTDTDTLLGSHAVITKPPSDHNVIATLFRTDGWGDERTAAVKNVEGYLVQGSRVPSLRIMDTHYKNSTQLRLYIVGYGSFPAAGDVVVLENPARIGVGDEFKQFVRLRNFTQSGAVITVLENGEAKEILVNIATYALEQPLKFDVFGPPVTKTFNQGDIPAESYFAKIYSTAIADSARFFGIKPLTVAAHVGDHSITVDGIFAAIVPNNTTEDAVIDATPTISTNVLVDSNYGSIITITRVQTTYTLQLPTGIMPGSIIIDLLGTGPTSIHSAVDSGGKIYNDDGTVLVAEIDYKSGVLNFLPVEYYTVYQGAIGFTVVVKYKAATLVDCDVLTTSLVVTQSNQGLNYVALIKPIPAPGSLKIEYVAQGRWYELTADMAGRIGGGSSAYGSGGINNATGSASISLGAVPDIGSQIIMSWGSNTTTLKPDAAKLPTKFTTLLDAGVDVYPANRTLAWVDLEGDARTATVSPSGIISGDATGNFVSQSQFVFSPSHYPNAAGVTLSYKAYTSASLTTVTSVAGVNGWSLDVSSGPIEQGSVLIEGHWWGNGDVFITLSDRAGELWGVVPDGSSKKLGTIDYATGAFNLDNFSIPSRDYGFQTNTIDGWGDVGASTVRASIDLLHQVSGAPTAHYYTAGAAGTATSAVLHPSEWRCKVPIGKSSTGLLAALVTASVCIRREDGLLLCGDSDGKLHALPDRDNGYAGQQNIGTIDSDGTIRVQQELMPRISSYSRGNVIALLSCLGKFPSLGTYSGIFRTQSFPLKPGNFQLYCGVAQASANSQGVISGDIDGSVDYKYGVVKWNTYNKYYLPSGGLLNPALIRYNAVALLVMPLSPALIGLDNARLPVDGRVPIYRQGDLLLVHNTQQFAVQSPVQKGVAYTLGRTNLSSVEVVDASGTLLPESLYTVDLTAGELTFSTGTDTSPYQYPWNIEHMVSDMVLCTSTDISGLLKTARALEHDYSTGTSYVSSLLVFGDLFARAFGDFAQQAMLYPWSDSRQGGEILPNYNNALYPIVVTNTGAIRERWALIFTSTTAYRIVGEDSGQIGTGTTTADCSPINPATGVPYFTIRSAGFGSGWSTGNVLRFNTDTAGNPFWILRTTLQGQAQADNDVFRVAFRGSVNRV
jgi:hypothetical protein